MKKQNDLDPQSQTQRGKATQIMHATTIHEASIPRNKPSSDFQKPTHPPHKKATHQKLNNTKTTRATLAKPSDYQTITNTKTTKKQVTPSHAQHRSQNTTQTNQPPETTPDAKRPFEQDLQNSLKANNYPTHRRTNRHTDNKKRKQKNTRTQKHPLKQETEGVKHAESQEHEPANRKT